MPTLDDTTHKLNGSTLYGKLDPDSGYWNVKLTKESSMLTTFNSNTRLGKHTSLKHYLLGLKPLRIHFRERLMKHTMHAEVQ